MQKISGGVISGHDEERTYCFQQRCRKIRNKLYQLKKYIDALT